MPYPESETSETPERPARQDFPGVTPDPDPANVPQPGTSAQPKTGGGGEKSGKDQDDDTGEEE